MITTRDSLVTLWACVLSGVYLPIMVAYREGGLDGVIADGMGANYIVWFSLIIATSQLKTTKGGHNPWLMGAALLCMVYPIATLSWIGASLCALSFLMITRGHIAAVLITAAVLREPFTAICLKIFAGNILNFDALLTNAVLFVMGKDVILNSNIVVSENAQPLLILTGCSVFANLSYISLLWLGLHVFYNCKITILGWGVLVFTTCLTLISNATRLALMTGSTDAYYFYHDGLGSQVFEWGLMGLALLIITGGCRYAQKA